MVVSTNLTSTFVSQLSVALTLGAFGTASHSTFASAGIDANLGASVSFVEIVCVFTLVLPQLSIAVHVRFIVNPQAPLFDVVSANLISTFLSQLSVAVTTPVAGTVGVVPHAAVTSAGTPAKVGAFVSFTVTVCTPVDLLPHLSVAVHVRLIV